MLAQVNYISSNTFDNCTSDNTLNYQTSTLLFQGWLLGLLGPTFPDLRLIVNKDLTTASWIFTTIALG